jgi:dsRNA-specific ribonuclease
MLVASGASKQLSFSCHVSVGNTSETGTGASKMLAKKDAAVKMLKKLDIAGEKELHLIT